MTVEFTKEQYMTFVKLKYKSLGKKPPSKEDLEASWEDEEEYRRRHLEE